MRHVNPYDRFKLRVFDVKTHVVYAATTDDVAVDDDPAPVEDDDDDVTTNDDDDNEENNNNDEEETITQAEEGEAVASGVKITNAITITKRIR